jgi:tyrosyl-tRNA synthetase
MAEREMAASKSEAKRLIQGGGVRLIPAGEREGEQEGQKVADPDAQIQFPATTQYVLQVGKRKFLRLNFQ